MKLRWSPEAAAEFAHLVRHIRKDNPSAATRVARVVVDGIAQLKKFPSLGRRGTRGRNPRARAAAASFRGGLPDTRRLC